MEKWEQEYFDKITTGVKLTEDELSELIDCCEDSRTYGDKNRWSVSATSIIEIVGRYFAIYWDEAATEMQENYYHNQPIEVKPVKKQVTITEWVAVTAN